MLIVVILILVGITIFALQNQTQVTIQFLRWHSETQLGLAMIAAAVAGAIVMFIPGFFRNRELHIQLKGVETRLRGETRVRESERQQKETDDAT